MTSTNTNTNVKGNIYMNAIINTNVPSQRQKAWGMYIHFPGWRRITTRAAPLVM